MKVYIVLESILPCSCGNYERTEVKGVFLDKDKANELKSEIEISEFNRVEVIEEDINN